MPVILLGQVSPNWEVEGDELKGSETSRTLRYCRRRVPAPVLGGDLRNVLSVSGPLFSHRPLSHALLLGDESGTPY